MTSPCSSHATTYKKGCIPPGPWLVIMDHTSPHNKGDNAPVMCTKRVSALTTDAHIGATYERG